MKSVSETDKAAIEAIEERDEEEIQRLRKIGVFKTMKQYMKGYWSGAILAWLFVAVEVVCEILIPWIAGQYLIPLVNPSAEVIINEGFSNAGQYVSAHLPQLFLYVGLMAGLAVVSCTGGIVAGFFAAKAAAGFGKNLRQAMYYRVQEFSFANIDRFSTASLVTRMTTDVTNVQNCVQTILRMVIRAPMMLVFALVMASLVSWQIALVYLAILPFLSLILFGIVIKVHPVFVRVFNAYDDLNSSVQENLQGIRVVKSYTRENFEKEKFGRVSYFIYRTFVRAERLIALNSPAMQLSIYTCMIVISYFGARMVVASGNAPDGFNTGSLTSLFSYTMRILVSLQFLSMGFVMITIARNSAERITEVLREEPDLTNPENPVFEVKDGAVDFENVCFRYYKNASKDVLHDINVHVPSGATVGILGVTGSSKSSFVSMIARLYDVDSGSVKVGGVDVRNYDIASLREKVAVVLQKNVLFSGTIRSNLLWGNPDATQEDLERAARSACADEFISKMALGYDSPVEQGGTNFSGGQRQRLCIARALLKNPKILILDDSTSAVDTHTDSLIRKAFATEIPDVTKFIVAQRILSIKDCDLILLLDDGKILAKGTNDELMASSPVYREIYETQMGGGDFDAAEN